MRTVIAIILAVLLSASHWKTYHAGMAKVQAKWDANTAEISAAIGKQNEANYAKERALNASIDKLKDDYAKEKSARLAAAAALDSGLRQFDATLDSSTPSPATESPSGANGAGGYERELLGACAATLVGMAKQADRLEQKVVALQAYINSLGLGK